MTSVIVSGHGHFATGITSSLELIMGVPKNYIAIDFPKESNIVELEKKMDEAIASFKGNDVIIFTDLFSGSPFNIAMKKKLEHSNVRVFYGTNLGMLIEVCSAIIFGTDVNEKISNVVETGKQQIGEFVLNEIDEDDEEQEEEL